MLRRLLLAMMARIGQLASKKGRAVHYVHEVLSEIASIVDSLFFCILLILIPGRMLIGRIPNFRIVIVLVFLASSIILLMDNINDR